MLSLSSIEDQTTMTCDVPDEQQGGWSTLALWFGWVILYHILIISFIGVKKLRCNYRMLFTSPLSFRVSSKAFREVCPRRRARWYKCAKRCEKQSEKTTPTEECCFAKCAMNLVKLHLPPPLPLKPKNKKNKRERRCAIEENCCTSSSSTCCTRTKPSQDSSAATSVVASENTRRSEKNKNEQDYSSAVPPPPPPQTPPSPVPLIDLARMQYWKSVVEQTTRRGAKYRDYDGLYPLHWACSGGPPVEVVQALLKAYPSAARKTDKEGSTALHFATHYSASATVAEALILQYPQAASVQDRYGRTPLLHAVEKSAGMDVLELLVRADAAVITLPCLPEGQRDVPITRGVAQRTPLYMAWSAVLFDRRARESRKGRKWEKAVLLLHSAFHHARQTKFSTTGSSSLTTTSSSFVSAAIELDMFLPAEVIEMAVTTHAQELDTPDEVTDRLPLLQAAAAPLVSRQRSDEIIQLLLQHCNASAVYARDAAGKSALQLALEAGKPWSAGVERLFHANPDAVHCRDKTGIVPALAAATVSTCIADSEAPQAEVDENPLGFLSPKYKEIMRRRRLQVLKPSTGEHKITCTEQVSTIFEALRADPSVVMIPARR